jgi:FKBP-type peptidyl-prolyl cis-trans isomerase
MSADLSNPNQPRSMFEPLEGRQLLSAGSGAEFLSADLSPAATFVTPFAKASTRTYIKQDSTATTFGGNVHLVATVTRRTGTPVTGGVVTFKAGSTVLGTGTVNLKGKAVLDTIKIPVGTASLTAVYNGTKSLATSTSAALAHTVAQASTTTTLIPADTTTLIGAPAVFTARVSPVLPGGGVPAGNVEFRDGTTLLATVALNKKGRAVLTKPDFFNGSHSITAKFVATTNYKTSSSSAKVQTVSDGTYTTTASGLKKATRVAGTGAAAQNGTPMTVNYTGYLTNGTKFDSSLNPGRTPFDVTPGQSSVIQGWHEGLVGMKFNETRVLVIPPALGYGATGQGSIPPNATLYFVITRLAPTLRVAGGANQSVSIPHGAAPSTLYGTAFGNVAVGQSSAAKTFTLSSIGSTDLNFTSNTPVQSSDADEFVVSALGSSNAGPTFTVTFKPKSSGMRTATITILTNDLRHPSYTFNVSGVGT